MHPPLTPHRHPMCLEIIEEFQKFYLDHPFGKFFGDCTELKVKLDRCFRRGIDTQYAYIKGQNSEQLPKHQKSLLP
ncbi:hypothetical protein Bca4012_030597 [Brassica carinata]|uniref:COX assembly mitochondrial protein n=1 Tax=Brassica carinata TaxID=52824 RepID=A0A8X7RHU4_BRACI|nr:hypothetical protein Bca52824_048134 [Brassica carinata]